LEINEQTPLTYDSKLVASKDILAGLKYSLIGALMAKAHTQVQKTALQLQKAALTIGVEESQWSSNTHY